jgi:hypothetical protein
MSELFDTINDHAPDRRIAIFVAATENLHPRPIGLHDVIAERGSEVVTPLLGALSESSNAETQVDIIDVFLSMQRNGYYDLARESAVIVRLERHVDNMPSGTMKRVAENKVQQIVRLTAQ